MKSEREMNRVNMKKLECKKHRKYPKLNKVLMFQIKKKKIQSSLHGKKRIYKNGIEIVGIHLYETNNTKWC